MLEGLCCIRFPCLLLRILLDRLPGINFSDDRQDCVLHLLILSHHHTFQVVVPTILLDPQFSKLVDIHNLTLSLVVSAYLTDDHIPLTYFISSFTNGGEHVQIRLLFKG